MSDERHADSVTHAQPVVIAERAPAPLVPRVAVDNSARATIAEHQRTFTAGGDVEPEPEAPPATGGPSLVDDAATRIRGLDRPSPFGVGQFPPLPIPPDRAQS